MKPLITIIIATYNSEKTIQTSLQSVLEQQYHDWECIVVDGASRDGTISKVEKYEKMDTRFRHISEPDKGVYDAFNKGVNLARGEWIYFLGSDDRLTGIGFKDLVIGCKEDICLVSGNVIVEKIDGTHKTERCINYAGCHQAKITRVSIIKDLGGFNEKYRILADRDLLVRMEKRGYKCSYVDTNVAYFKMDGLSQRLEGQLNRLKERINIYKANDMDFSYIMELIIFLKIILSIFYRKTRLYLMK